MGQRAPFMFGGLLAVMIECPCFKRLPLFQRLPGGQAPHMRNQGSSASLIELALIIVLIAIIVMAILLIVGDDLRLWIVNTVLGLFSGKS